MKIQLSWDKHATGCPYVDMYLTPKWIICSCGLKRLRETHPDLAQRVAAAR